MLFSFLFGDHSESSSESKKNNDDDDLRFEEDPNHPGQLIDQNGNRYYSDYSHVDPPGSY